MKSRISCFSAAVYKKDLTRFAPAWAIYLAGCLLVILNLVMASGSTSYAADTLGQSLSVMAFANFGYAFVCAQLLFGDLFNGRLCNALHAMPLRRETWFCTHLLSAITVSLAPYLVVALLCMPVLDSMWPVGLLWLLGSELEFLFFFAVAVFCVFCTGSRFAMALFYGLLNFGSLLVGWFVQLLYDPLLPGMTISMEWTEPLCPVYYMMAYSDWMNWYDKISRAASGIGDCWRYLMVLTVIGVGLLAAALALYRRRKLECAGDFVAVKGLGPVFLTAYTLTVAMLFQAFDSIFIYSGSVSLFFYVGLAIGFFTGQMLLRRTVKVFQKKVFLGFALLAALLLGSVGVVKLDPMGVTRWVPAVEDVQAVGLDGYGYYYQGISITDEADIAVLTRIHAQAIEENRENETDYNGATFYLNLSYRMKDGRTVEREYRLDAGSALVQGLKPYFSDPQVLLRYTDWEEFLGSLYQIRIDWDDDQIFTGQEAAELAEAIRKDCEEGNMAQIWSFHDQGNNPAFCSVDVVASANHFELTIYSDSAHAVAWLKAHGIE